MFRVLQQNGHPSIFLETDADRDLMETVLRMASKQFTVDAAEMKSRRRLSYAVDFERQRSWCESLRAALEG